jgi:hypothetical protein
MANTTNRSLTAMWCLGGVVSLLAAAGCSSGDLPERGQVAGAVTYNGQPLEEGEIVFYPDEGRPARGEIVDGQIVEVGTFEADDGVTAGHCRIIIRARQAGADMYTPSEHRIPPHYANAEESGLETTIKPGTKNELTLELTD